MEQYLDAGHIRFAGYTRTAIKDPIELWEDLDGDDAPRPVFRSLAALRVEQSDSYHFMHVLIEKDSHIVTTAYVGDYEGRIETYRKGRLLVAAWAA